MRVRKHLLLVVALGASPAVAAAQTGRIALASHAGRAAGADDNFGIVPKPRPAWRADTLAYVNDSLALHSGQMRGWVQVDKHSQIVWTRKSEQVDYRGAESTTPQAIVESLRQEYPHAVFIGFDRWGKHPQKKPSKGAQLLPKRPFQYSYWRELAGAVALGAVGWLRGRKAEMKAKAG